MTVREAVLVSKHGYYVGVKDEVFGTSDIADTSVDLEMSTVDFGKLHIKGKETGQYIAMDSEGILYTTTEDLTDCVWLELYDGKGYNFYRSEQHGFLLGIQSDGQPKEGAKTAEGQCSVLFMVSSRDTSRGALI